eukprot:g4040.t1
MSEPSDVDSDDSEAGGLFGDMFKPTEEDMAASFQKEYSVETPEGSLTKVTVRLEGVDPEFGQVAAATGFTLWAASEKLAQYLASKEGAKRILRKNVIELGAGLGLCGILASSVAKTCVLTDGDSRVLEKTKRNVALNECDVSRVECAKLRWGPDVHSFMQQYPDGFDVVLGADIIYDEDVVDVLFQTVASILALKDGSIMLLAYERRNVSVDFALSVAASHGLSCTDLSAGEKSMFLFRKVLGLDTTMNEEGKRANSQSLGPGPHAQSWANAEDETYADWVKGR